MLTPPRKALLSRLIGSPNGRLRSEELTVPERRLATQMQRDGLVMWKATPFVSNRHSLAGQVLFVTREGLEMKLKD